MNRDQALYFLEGLTVGIAANERSPERDQVDSHSPSRELLKRLYCRLAKEHDLIPAEFEIIRPEIDGYLDEAEGEMDADITNLIKIGKMVARG